MRQEYATHFAWRTAIYNERDIYNGFRFRFFRFWFSASNVAVLNERFERSEIFRWDI